jgi:hypothetical protein
MADDKDQSVTVETSADNGPSKLPDSETISPESVETVAVSVAQDSSGESTSPQTEKVLEKQPLDPAMAGRVSVLEKERNELSKQNEDLEKLNRLFATSNDALFRGNKSAYEKWRQAVISNGGQDFGSYETLYGNTQGQEPMAAHSDAASVTQNTDLNLMRSVARQELENDQGFKQFVDAVPEMDPRKLDTEEKRKAAAGEFDKVIRLSATYRSVNPTLSSGDAFIEAYNFLHPENRQRQIRHAEETGVLIGKAQAYAKGAGEAGSIGGGTAKSTETTVVQMTKTQKERYDQLVTEKGKKFADLYARNVASYEE